MLFQIKVVSELHYFLPSIVCYSYAFDVIFRQTFFKAFILYKIFDLVFMSLIWKNGWSLCRPNGMSRVQRCLNIQWSPEL